MGQSAHWWRFRFQPESIQSCHSGIASARLEFQAVHLFCGTGEGLYRSYVVNDAPLTFTAAQTGSEPWEPKNYDGKFDGPMRLRTGLAKSKNLYPCVCCRRSAAICPRLHCPLRIRSQTASTLPNHGAGCRQRYPLQMLGAYSVFANAATALRLFRRALSKITRAMCCCAISRSLQANPPSGSSTHATHHHVRSHARCGACGYRDTGFAPQTRRSCGKNRTTNELSTPGSVVFSLIWWRGVVGFDQPKTLGRNETAATSRYRSGSIIWGRTERRAEESSSATRNRDDADRSPKQACVPLLKAVSASTFTRSFRADHAGETAPGAEKLPDDARNQLF